MLYKEEILFLNGLPFVLEHAKGYVIPYIKNLHRHNAVEILYVISGNFNAVLNHELHVLNEGDILFINSNIVHNFFAGTTPDVEYFYLQFPPEMIYSYGESSFNHDYFMLLAIDKQNSFSKFNIKKDAPPHKLFYEMYKDITDKPPGYENAFYAKLLKFSVWLFDIWSTQNQIVKKVSDSEIIVIKEILEYIDKNYMNAKFSDLCKKYNYSPSYLSKLFKSATGHNFSDYIEEYRMSQAKFSLSTSKASVTEIAFSVGYTNTSYFSKRFYLKNKMSPTEFRQKNIIRG